MERVGWWIAGLVFAAMSLAAVIYAGAGKKAPKQSAVGKARTRTPRREQRRTEAPAPVVIEAKPAAAKKPAAEPVTDGDELLQEAPGNGSITVD